MLAPGERATRRGSRSRRSGPAGASPEAAAEVTCERTGSSSARPSGSSTSCSVLSSMTPRRMSNERTRMRVVVTRSATSLDFR